MPVVRTEGEALPRLNRLRRVTLPKPTEATLAGASRTVRDRLCAQAPLRTLAGKPIFDGDSIVELWLPRPGRSAIQAISKSATVHSRYQRHWVSGYGTCPNASTRWT